MSVGHLYARTLQPLAEQLIELIPGGATVAVLGDDTVLAPLLEHRRESHADWALVLCPDGDVAKLLDDCERCATRAAVACWSRTCASRHELVLDDVLRSAGLESVYLDGLLLDAIRLHEGWRRELLRDVVRFDGIGDLWATMVRDRPPLAAEVDALDYEAVSQAMRDCEESLAPFTAADGTMRIPVEAVLLLR